MNVFRYCLFTIALIPLTTWACNGSKTYTIGAYDEAFEKHRMVAKLGPIPAADVHPSIPPSFLERDGSYGGGEATCTISEACQLLRTQLQSGLLPRNENWHIYLLDANWHNDVYQLHDHDYRIKHPVRVLKRVRKKCN